MEGNKNEKSKEEERPVAVAVVVFNNKTLTEWTENREEINENSERSLKLLLSFSKILGLGFDVCTGCWYLRRADKNWGKAYKIITTHGHLWVEITRDGRIEKIEPCKGDLRPAIEKPLFRKLWRLRNFLLGSLLNIEKKEIPYVSLEGRKLRIFGILPGFEFARTEPNVLPSSLSELLSKNGAAEVKIKIAHLPLLKESALPLFA